MKKLLLLIAAIFMGNCGSIQTSLPDRPIVIVDSTGTAIDTAQTENDSIFLCETPESTDTIPSLERLRVKNRSMRIDQPKPTLWVVVGSGFSKFKGGFMQGKQYVDFVIEQAKKQEAAEGFELIINGIEYLTPENDWSIGISNVQNLLALLHINRPFFNADRIIFINTRGSNGGGVANIVGGTGKPGLNGCVAMIGMSAKAFPAFSYEVNTVLHEIRHLDGDPHSHDCVHTVVRNGVEVTRTQLDNFGTLQGYGSRCVPADIYPLTPDIGFCMSYVWTGAFRSRASMYLHPLHLEYRKAYLASTKLGCHNTAFDVRFENGEIKFKDDFKDKNRIQFGKYVPGGNMTFSKETVISKAAAQEVLTLEKPTTYPSSGSTGYRFPSKTLLSGYDSIQIEFTGTLAPKAQILSSAWLGSKSIGKQAEFKLDGVIPFSAFGVTSMDKIQIRPTINSDFKITKVKFIKAGTASTEFSQPIAAMPNSFYYVKIRPECDGLQRGFFIHTPPTNWNGAQLTDLNGINGLVYSNQQYWYAPIPAGKIKTLTFSAWQLTNITGWMEIWIDGKLFGKYNANAKPPTITSDKEIRIGVNTMSSGGHGWVIDVTEK